jgi:hypothetical protein
LGKGDAKTASKVNEPTLVRREKHAKQLLRVKAPFCEVRPFASQPVSALNQGIVRCTFSETSSTSIK